MPQRLTEVNSALTSREDARPRCLQQRRVRSRSERYPGEALALDQRGLPQDPQRIFLQRFPLTPSQQSHRHFHCRFPRESSSRFTEANGGKAASAI